MQGYKQGAQGILLTDWGDGGHHQTLPISFPAIVYTAHLAWSGKPLSKSQLSSELARTCFGQQKNIATLLLKMGHTHKDLKTPVMNGNAFHHLLFDTKKITTPTDKQLTNTLLKLESYHEQLKKYRQLQTQEMCLSLNLAMLGIKKHLTISGKMPYPRDLATQTLGQFEELWLQRNRIGGLHESSSKLRTALQL